METTIESKYNLRGLLLSGSIAIVAGILAGLALVHQPLRPDGEAVLGSPQIVLFETARCQWCADFSENVIPPFKETEYGVRIGVRVISVDDGQAPRRYRLASPLGHRSSVVFFDQYGRELGRIGRVETVDDVTRLVRRYISYLPRG